MKITIRKMTFETNSSSTHSLIMCSEEEFEKLNREKLYIDNNYWTPELRTKEEVINIIKEDNNYKDEDLENEEKFKQIRKDFSIYTIDEYLDDEYLKCYVDSYTTKNNEKIYAFGLYGYNG